MANILFICERIPYPLTAGDALRVFNAAQQLSARGNTCFLAVFEQNSTAVATLDDTGVFQRIIELPACSEKPSFARHLRLSKISYWRKSCPAYFNVVNKILQGAIRTENIDVVVAVTLHLAEFCLAISGVIKIVDDYDCVTLTLRRELKAGNSRISSVELANRYLDLFRAWRLERELTRHVDAVTTISPVDLLAMRAMSCTRQHAIRLLPNGINQELIGSQFDSDEIPRAVAFWGNMDFGPNLTAIRFFYQQVFVPYLRDMGVAWYIAGKNPAAEIKEIAEREPLITVTGYVENLYELVARIPVMINPMVSGSGLKNKVLEAFALGRAVVSSSLGMEAITAEDKVHFWKADAPHEFAEAILTLLESPSLRGALGAKARELVEERYTWNKVGDLWQELITELLQAKTSVAQLSARI